MPTLRICARYRRFFFVRPSDDLGYEFGYGKWGLEIVFVEMARW